MKSITVTFDPDNGVAVRDGDIRGWCDEVIENTDDNCFDTIFVSNAAILHFLLLRHVQKKVCVENVTFRRGNEITHAGRPDRFGRIKWPPFAHTFCWIANQRQIEEKIIRQAEEEAM